MSLSNRPSIRLPGIALWLIPSLATAVVLARLGVWLARDGYGFALLPVLLGAAVGVSSGIFAKWAELRGAAALIAGAIVLSLVCVAAEHAFFYLDYRAKIQNSAKSDQQLELLANAGQLPTPSFTEFLRSRAFSRPSDGQMPNWQWWLIDAAMTIVGSIGAMWFVMLNRNRAASPVAKTDS
jgi:hypothetical protein